MSDLHEKRTQWLLKLNPGDKAMLYQPRITPRDELALVQRILTKHPIEKAFYTKISINTKGGIFDYHLIGLELKPEFSSENFLVDLSINEKKLNNFKFLDLNNNMGLSNQIRKSKIIYE